MTKACRKLALNQIPQQKLTNQIKEKFVNHKSIKNNQKVEEKEEDQ